MPGTDEAIRRAEEPVSHFHRLHPNAPPDYDPKQKHLWVRYFDSFTGEERWIRRTDTRGVWWCGR